jgi:hypothetical protein
VRFEGWPKGDFNEHGKYELEQTFHFSFSKYNHAAVHTGFYTDGASIPRIFWTIIGDPFQKRVIRPALGHDYLYWSGKAMDGRNGIPEKITRKQADRAFYEGLRNEGMRKSKALAMYWGVRLGGWRAWNDYRKQQP